MYKKDLQTRVKKALGQFAASGLSLLVFAAKELSAGTQRVLEQKLGWC